MKLSKSRLTLAQAEKVEFELSVKKGEYIRTDQVIRSIFAFTRNCRDMLMLFPSRRSADIAAALECDHGKVVIVLEQHIREALIEIANIPLPDFSQIGDDEENGQDASDQDDSEREAAG
ncbi:hypothetical protein [Bartonella sp. DGB2]|uniref:hypothetical protein n=1 Tax=Bartonella sp. DGB2 TaxID=3388426 RepID=UPI0039902BE9